MISRIRQVHNEKLNNSSKLNKFLLGVSIIEQPANFRNEEKFKIPNGKNS